ncbi:uncharacterized protein TRIADDRAFT_55197 [Trichoplax adhaerens]|uniref:Nicastrin n=1 Tax=Trichoplax adhaerens TaxID=10228 RepID=B3RU89_TRIAD|nr:hypothetical protein TRIADDRAFT_55197 [Trichoplax adhaerens]EDV25767.1 hypothetical protein TRIADDRAFT_55197 [Trichoplax adhaerens]|eukprot:XP_002111800.1 hypothetical protein TRIADDRAFT_55197 [Trichoplax adhaerens]
METNNEKKWNSVMITVLYSRIDYVFGIWYKPKVCYLVIVINEVAHGQTVNKLVYRDITSFNYCVRYTNKNHSIGCTSKYWRNVGVLHLVESFSDMNKLATSKLDIDYVPLMTPKLFNLDNVNFLMSKRKIAGIIILGANDTASDDKEIPDGMYVDNSQYQSCKRIEWNPHGSGMLYKSFDFPIFRVYMEDDIQRLKQCYLKHNMPTSKGELIYPLCAVQMGDFMFTPSNTEVCMRRNIAGSLTSGGFCDPLGDSNVWSTLYPMNNPLKERELIIAAAQLDSISQFYNFAPGTDNDASGFITLLSAAYALGKAKNSNKLTKPKKPIMFAFFQGESWDYIGSSRMDWPANITLKNIGQFLELRQVGLEDEKSLWAHFDPSSGDKSRNDAFFAALVKAGTGAGVNISKASNDLPLPPASVQRFLRKDSGLSGLVLTDHKKNFTNAYYNSHYDSLNQVMDKLSSQGLRDPNSLSKHLTRLATTVARTLYMLASDSNPTPDLSKITADEDMTSELLHCFLQNASCTLFQQVVSNSNAKNLPSSAYPRMVGVSQSPNQVTNLTNHLMMYFTGNQLADVTKQSNCKSNTSDNSAYNYLWFQGQDFKNVCYRGTVYYSPAVSPAFLLKDYKSKNYSTWAESRWQSVDLKMFLVPNPSLQTHVSSDYIRRYYRLCCTCHMCGC